MKAATPAEVEAIRDSWSGDGRAPKRQSGLTMPTALWLYVDDLRRTGLYGEATSNVLRTLIQQGIQDAIAKGVIGVRSEVQRP